MLPEVRAPHGVRIRHISKTEPLEGQLHIGLFPALSQSHRQRPDRAVSNAFISWVRVVIGIAHTAQTQRLWRLSASWMYRSKPLSFPCCRNQATVSTAQSGRIPACTSRVTVSNKITSLYLHFCTKKEKEPVKIPSLFCQKSVILLRVSCA